MEYTNSGPLEWGYAYGFGAAEISMKESTSSSRIAGALSNGKSGLHRRGLGQGKQIKGVSAVL
jgi:hypothetical protein